MIKLAYDDLKTEKYNIQTVEKITTEGKIYKLTECDSIITFDIETSSGYRQPDGSVIGYDYITAKLCPEYYNMADSKTQAQYGKVEPVGIMYVWQAHVETTTDHHTYIGRTWETFQEFLDCLTEGIHHRANNHKKTPSGWIIPKNRKAKIPAVHIYVHNFSFEFNFLRNIFTNDFAKISKRPKVFARERNNPLKAEINYGGCRIIFHDTLCLVNKSLKNWCKDESLPVQKLDEPQDYYLPVRTPLTPLTDEELQYSNNDVECMYYGMKKFRSEYGHLCNIPMTQTGRIRPVLRDRVARMCPDWVTTCQNVYASYKLEDIKDLYDVFTGGWTHANAWRTGRSYGSFKANALTRCFDFRSSYPAVMSQFTFPVTGWADITEAEKNRIDAMHPVHRNRRYYMQVTITNLMSTSCNTYLSLSKTDDIHNYVVDNGKLVYAEQVTFKCTDLDWITISHAYEWDSIEYNFIRAADADYLPPEFIKLILDFYADKTSLKNVPGAESRYATAKVNINILYGEMVLKEICDAVMYLGETLSQNQVDMLKEYNLITDNDVVYDENGDFDADATSRKLSAGWIKHESTEADFDAVMMKNAMDPYLYKTPQIGIWVTSAARFNLWSVMLGTFSPNYHGPGLDAHTIYGDTDSLKGLYDDEDMKVIEAYNKEVKDRYTRVAAHVSAISSIQLTPQDWEPKTPKGVVKELGYFDEEDSCIFKTLGAKRYVDITKGEDGYELHATIAGISKICAEKKLAKISGVPYHQNDKGTVILDTDDEADLLHVLDGFCNGLTFEPEETSKLTAFYNYNTKPCHWVDYNGQGYTSTDFDKYSVCLIPAPFRLGLAGEYAMLLKVLAGQQNSEWSNVAAILRRDAKCLGKTFKADKAYIDQLQGISPEVEKLFQKI